MDNLGEEEARFSSSSEEEQRAPALRSPRLQASAEEDVPPHPPIEESSAVEVERGPESSPDPPPRVRHRRRGARDTSCCQSDNRAIVDRQVLNYLTDRRKEGKDERLPPGVVTLSKSWSAKTVVLFNNLVTSVATIMTEPQELNELMRTVDCLKQRIMMRNPETQPGPSMVQTPHPQPSQSLYSQDRQLDFHQPYPGPSHFHPQFQHPPGDFGPRAPRGPFTRELFDI